MFEGHIFQGTNAEIALLGFGQESVVAQALEQMKIVMGRELVGQIIRH